VKPPLSWESRLLALLVIASAIAGCGGGSGSASDKTRTWPLPGSGTIVSEDDPAIHEWGAWLGPCIYKVSQAALASGNTAFTPLDAAKNCAVESCFYPTTVRREFERARALGLSAPPLLKNEEISGDSEVCLRDHLYIATIIVPAVYAEENP
jgi:hypothetical protein